MSQNESLFDFNDLNVINTNMKFIVKIIYSEKTCSICFGRNCSINYFLKEIINLARNYFRLDNKYKLEIVETCNYINGDAEMGPALESIHNQSIEKRYGYLYDKDGKITLYLRVIDKDTNKIVYFNE